MPRSTLETDMYLDDIIDHVKAYFAGNDSAIFTLKIKNVEGVCLALNHAIAGFAARHVTGVAINAKGKFYDRAYIVLEYPNGEIETLEIGCLMKRQAVLKEVDAICERFLTKAA